MATVTVLPDQEKHKEFMSKSLEYLKKIASYRSKVMTGATLYVEGKPLSRQEALSWLEKEYERVLSLRSRASSYYRSFQTPSLSIQPSTYYEKKIQTSPSTSTPSPSYQIGTFGTSVYYQGPTVNVDLSKVGREPVYEFKTGEELRKEAEKPTLSDYVYSFISGDVGLREKMPEKGYKEWRKREEEKEYRRRFGAFTAGIVSEAEAIISPKAPSLFGGGGTTQRTWTSYPQAKLGMLTSEVLQVWATEKAISAVTRVPSTVPRITRREGKFMWELRVKLPKEAKSYVKIIDESSEMIYGVAGDIEKAHGIKGVAKLEEVGKRLGRLKKTSFIPSTSFEKPVVREEIKGIRDVFGSLKRLWMSKREAQTVLLEKEGVNKMLKEAFDFGKVTAEKPSVLFKEKEARAITDVMKSFRATKKGEPISQLVGQFKIYEQEAFALEPAKGISRKTYRFTKLGETKVPLRVEELSLDVRGMRTGRFRLEVPSAVELPEEKVMGFAGKGKKSARNLFEDIAKTVEKVDEEIGKVEETSRGKASEIIIGKPAQKTSPSFVVPRVMEIDEIFTTSPLFKTPRVLTGFTIPTKSMLIFRKLQLPFKLASKTKIKIKKAEEKTIPKLRKTPFPSLEMKELSLNLPKIGTKTIPKITEKTPTTRKVPTTSTPPVFPPPIIPILPPIAPPSPPIIPSLPSLGIDLKLPKLKRARRRKYGYEPSLTALAFNIRGLIPKIKKFTGLELRPLPLLGKKRKRSRKRKRR